MEIQLSAKQKSIIEGAFQEQQKLQQEAQSEFMKIQKRIDDAVSLILDSKGVEMVQGIQFKEGVLIVPDAPKDEPVVMEVVKDEPKE